MPEIVGFRSEIEAFMSRLRKEVVTSICSQLGCSNSQEWTRMMAMLDFAEADHWTQTVQRIG